EMELDNLRGALAWSQDPNAAPSEIETSQGPISGVEAGLRLVVGTFLFWFLRVHRREGWRWLEAGLALGVRVDVTTRARGLMTAGFLGYTDGGTDLKRSLALLEESLEVFRGLEDNARIAQTPGCLTVLVAA